MRAGPPPALPRALLALVAPPDRRDAILGDLEEEWRHRSPGPRARRWYWGQVLRSLAPLIGWRLRRARGRRSHAREPHPPMAGRRREPAVPVAHPRTHREGRRKKAVSTMLEDLRYGLRTLVRNPGFSAVVVLTLSLGIGATTVVFSAVNGTVLNPFPFPEPDRIVGVGTAYPMLGEELGFFENLSPAEYEDIRDQTRTLEDVVSWDMGFRQVTTGGPPESTFTAFWWGDALETLQMRPHLGRGFTDEEVREGARVALVTHRFWRRSFGADSSRVGGTILVNDVPHTLVGVLPEGVLIYGTDLWTVMPVSPGQYPRNRRQFQILARIREGTTLPAVNTELEGIARRVEAAWSAEFEEYADWRAEARTWTDVNVATLKPVGFILMGAVGFLLLLVCANVANMLLARATGRRREMAVRTAMGAGRIRLVRQLLTESVALAGAGGLAGLGLALLGVRAVSGFLDTVGAPVPGEVTLDGTVLLFTAAVSVGAGLLFGLAPALQTAGRRLRGTLQAEAKGTTASASRQRLQRALVGVEVALALALLAGGGLLLRSVIALASVEPGWDAGNVLTMRLTLPPERYGPEEIQAFFPLLAERVEGLPGVRSAAAATQFPGRLFSRSEFTLEGDARDPDATLPSAFTTVVTPGFFQTLGVDVVRGRAPSADDPPGAPLVGVVNQAAARTHFPGQDPVGRRIHLGGPDDDRPWIEVVGVVADTRNRGLEVEPAPELFAAQQQVGGGNQLFLLVRTDVPPRSVLAGVREVVREMDPDQPVYAIRTGSEVYADQAASRRATAAFVTGFAAFALLLAALGIYAVVSYSVTSRTREIGVRMALGARAGRVRRLVVAQALLPVGLGALVGLGLSVPLGWQLEAVLFGVGGNDPPTLAGVTALLVTVALAASWVPALRASRLDPARTLRSE